jgi:hypothetical protein
VVEDGLGVERDAADLDRTEIALGKVPEVGAQDVADQIVVFQEVDAG